jgi:2-iminobutanoate/2-iminopropanoate deaminase
VTKIEAIPGLPDRSAQYGYSAALAHGDLLFVAGQASIDDQGQIVGDGDFMAQAHQVFANLRRVLEAGGSSLADVLKVTVFVTDMSVFPQIVALRHQYFTAPYPADSLVQVAALAFPELMIEIEAIAVRRT